MAWIPWFAMIAQLCCLLVLAFGEILDPEGNAGGGIVVFSIAAAAVVIPMIVYKAAKRPQGGRYQRPWKSRETFEETFPKPEVKVKKKIL